MQVTAIIPDDLVNEVTRYSGGDDFADSLVAVLKEWLSLQKMKELNQNVEANPLEFSEGFSAQSARSINRNQ
jgi:hypothetical protein